MGLDTAIHEKHCQTELKGTEKWQDSRGYYIGR